MNFKLNALSTLFPVGIIIVFMYWYQWGSQTLSSNEVDAYMKIIEAQTQNTSARHDLSALRKFLSEDDGKPFYTINLYNFNALANYPTDSEYQSSGEQAYDRFSQVMVPLMLKRGSHPVFGSYWNDSSNSRWDRIVIVRYRSRRDLVDLFTTKEFAQASLHKWASLEGHERMLVQATHIPHGIFIITIIAAMIGVLIYVACRSLRFFSQYHAGK